MKRLNFSFLMITGLLSSLSALADMTCDIKNGQFVDQSAYGTASNSQDAKTCAKNAIENYVICSIDQNITPQVLREYSAGVQTISGNATTPNFNQAGLSDSSIENMYVNLDNNQITALTEAAGTVNFNAGDKCNATGNLKISNPALEQNIKNKYKDAYDKAIYQANIAWNVGMGGRVW